MRVLIVDDERLARAGIRQHLRRMPDVQVVAECASGDEAVRAIDEHHPDLVFLDVQMPGLDGFQVIERVGVDRMPAVIFVTAWDDYAVRAFEADAVDYLLKPFDDERFRDAFARASRRIELEQSGRLSARLESLLERLERPLIADTSHNADRIPVTRGGRIVFLSPADIEWIEAAGNYARLHVRNETHLVRNSLETMERRLAPRFLRVRRSALVNREAIESVEPYAKGSWLLRLRAGAAVRTSRHYRANIAPLLGGRGSA